MSQSTALESNVASMKQIAGMVDGTDQVSKKSEENTAYVTNQVSEGIATVNELVASMEIIREQEEQLSKITSIIDDIAAKTNVINDIVFQTKLLSFNASVESERAGEHGRGFSVVAAEVGNLAKLSGQAASDIKLLIQSSQKQVKDCIEGTQNSITRAEDATKSTKEIFDQINKSINQLNKQVEKVSQANTEQKDGIAQVSDGLSKIECTTRENTEISKYVEELSQRLQKQGKELDQIAKTISDQVGGLDSKS